MSFNHTAFNSAYKTFIFIALFTGASGLTVNAGSRAKKIQRSSHTEQPAAKITNRSDSSARKTSSHRLTPPEARRLSRAAMQRERAVEMRRLQRQREAAARLAAIARQRALDEGMRNQVRSLIDRDNTSGEDPEVRRVAVNALGNHAGTVVVMDPGTGRVYTIVNQEWALRQGFKPCSTIKLVTGLAGLNENVINPGDSANISNTNRIGLTDALAYSNNTYFQQVGGRVGYDRMITYARLLGLGEKTGINAPNETAGQLPASRSGYAVNHMSSHGDDFKVTAVQLATLVSAMANGGRLLSPRVPRNSDSPRSQAKVRRVLNLDLRTLGYMVPGMVGAVNYGSGRRAQNSQAVAGKTGTCIENGTWIGLFTSYAPVVNPKLAVVVIARGADAHSHFPAAVAGRIYRELNGRFGTPTNLQIANGRSLMTDPRAALNEEDDDEGEDSAKELKVTAASRTRGTTSSPHILETSMSSAISISEPARSPRPNWRDSKTPAGSTVKRVLMTIPIKPSETKIVPSVSTRTIAPQVQTRPRRVSDLQR